MLYLSAVAGSTDLLYSYLELNKSAPTFGNFSGKFMSGPLYFPAGAEAR